MADTRRRPLLNPVLRFTKDPKPEQALPAGGKELVGSRTDRLPEQRKVLAEQFADMAARVADQPELRQPCGDLCRDVR